MNVNGIFDDTKEIAIKCLGVIMVLQLCFFVRVLIFYRYMLKYLTDKMIKMPEICFKIIGRGEKLEYR